MKIGELEEKSGVPRTTIHYYLRQGLLHPPVKTGRTMAHYDESHLRRLKEIQSLKKDARAIMSILKEHRVPNVISEKSLKAYGGKSVTTTKEKELKRKAIIRKAIEVFSSKGYHHSKIIDITQALNISTGTFYLYFKNKRDVFIEGIDDVFRSIVEEAAIAIKGEKDFLERMKTRGRVFYKYYTKYSEIINQLRAETACEEKWPEDKIKNIYHGLTQPVIQDIEAAINEGILRKVDPDLLSYSLTGQIEIMSLRLSLDHNYDVDEVVDFIVNLCLHPLLIEEKK